MQFGAEPVMGKQFLLFGRGTDKESELDSRIAEKERVIAEMKRESANIISEAQRHSDQINKEKNALRILRDEATKRIKAAEQKESRLKEIENSLSQKSRAVAAEEARIQKMKKEEGFLRASIDELGHAYDEKKSALEGRQKAIVSLTKELNSLLQKRADVKRLETVMVSAIEKEKNARMNADKMEKRVAEGERLVVDQALHIEKNRRVMAQLAAQVSEMSSLKKNFDSDIAERRKTLLAIEREMTDMDSAVKDVIATKEQFEQKKAFLAQRDRQLSEQERRVDEKKRQLAKLSFDAEAAEKSKQELMVFIEEKKHVIAEMKSSVAENSQTVKELHEHEINARRGAHDLEVAQHKADKTLKMLDSKEKDLIRRETAVLEHEKSLKEAVVMLSKDKKELMEEVNARKAELLLVKQEWEKKFSELGEEKRDLKREKSDVRSLVQSDVLALKDKEDEVVTAIAMFERDKDKLLAEEKSLLKRVAELERAKAEFEREVKVLSSKEKRIADGERIVQKGMKYVEIEKRKLEDEKDKVYRARELKKILPSLEKRYEQLKKTSGRLEARSIEIGTTPKPSRLLKEREHLVSEKEAGVQMEMRKLMDREREVEDLESRKERAFSEYLREEVERARMGKPGREIVNPEIHGMIDDAREKVMQGKLDEAVRLVAEAEYLVDRVPNANEKRLLSYDIRDLKASIKLATLT